MAATAGVRAGIIVFVTICGGLDAVTFAVFFHRLRNGDDAYVVAASAFCWVTSTMGVLDFRDNNSFMPAKNTSREACGLGSLTFT